MKYIKIGNQTIAYTEHGRGQPLILLPANPGDQLDFTAVIPHFARQFQVFTLDWPGFGASPAPENPQSTTAMWFADLLQTFICEVGLKDVVLIGNSVGGYAAARAAIEMPERLTALVLVSSGGFTNHNAFTRLFSRLQGSEWITQLTVKAFANFYLHKKTAVTRAMVHRAETNQRKPTAVAVNAAIWRSFLQPEHDLRQQASQIQCPTLVINGEHDPVIPADKDGKTALTVIPNAQQIVLDTGHAPFAEAPQIFVTAVDQFLAENHLLHERVKDCSKVLNTSERVLP